MSLVALRKRKNVTASLKAVMTIVEKVKKKKYVPSKSNGMV